jgi:nicotinate-nucleotide adenylyltransferase
MKLGLFGGSFNPIHNAHLRIAAEARAACRLDRVIFIPAADPPHKPVAGNVSFEHRAAMVSMAIADNPAYATSTIEAERRGKSYSIDTIRIFRERCPGDNLFFIIGADSFLDIGTWHRYSEIFSLCSLVVVNRPGCPINPHDTLPEAARDAFTVDSATGNLNHSSGTKVFFITGSPLDLSSTDIRRLVAAGDDITRYVPSEVAAYILRQRIYQQCQ